MQQLALKVIGTNVHLQWNLHNTDTIGTTSNCFYKRGVPTSEVSGVTGHGLSPDSSLVSRPPVIPQQPSFPLQRVWERDYPDSSSGGASVLRILSPPGDSVLGQKFLPQGKTSLCTSPCPRIFPPAERLS